MTFQSKIEYVGQSEVEDFNSAHSKQETADAASVIAYEAPERHKSLSSFSKRIFDRVIALLSLIFIFPLLAIIAVLIKLYDGGPVLFVQRRIGVGGKSFNCYKLRSMVTDAQSQLDALLATDAQARAEWGADQKLTKDPRITPLGNFLRKSSIDELPQLWNIIRGEMSIVGPRPIIANEIPRYGDKFDAYSSVRPGLTGLWQISGRNDTTYEERVDMDVKYVSEWSFANDMYIFFMTLPAVIISKGAR